jgi:small subunit ribosomal protein S21
MEIILGDDDRLDWALKSFRRKMARAGILAEVKRRRHYLKPSVAKRLKTAEAERRKRKAARKMASR